MGNHAHARRRARQSLRRYYHHPRPTHILHPPPHTDTNDELTGGIFRALLTFPPTYPHLPPTLTFTTPIFHPNIYAPPSGAVCISILHPPEDDAYGYEKASERWSPVQTPESILLSVISLLGSPNDESAADAEAGRLWREDRKEFRRRVRRCVRDSMEA